MIRDDVTLPCNLQPIDADAVLSQSSRSFSIAVRFLPARLRTHVKALYAWCRYVDDTVDRAKNEEQADKILHVLDQDLIRIRTGTPIQHTASAWIQPLIAMRAIDPRHAHELIEGMFMDLRHDSVDNRADLERYCYHVAGTVGLMMTRLMGVKDPAADRHAIALGIAMQLTNIARDVREDAERGRSYLPGIRQPLATEARKVKAAVADILTIAEHHYEQASQGLMYLPWNCRLSIRVALSAYREIGRQIHRNDCEVLHGRTVISKPRLIQVSMMAVISSFQDDVRFATKRLMHSLSQFLKEFSMNEPTTTQQQAPVSTIRQAKQTVYLGLSLTLIMATPLFVIVFFNPKSTDYAFLPLLYAGLSLLGSFVFHRLSARCDAAPQCP